MHVEPLKTIRERLDQFSGREWLLPILRDWLEKGDERIFLLKGDPGTGKSMIVAWLAERVPLVDMPELVIADHFLQVNSRNVTPLVFAEGIANQLSNSLDGFDEALTDSLKLKGLNINVFQNIENADESATIIGVQIGRISLAELANEDSFDLGFVQPLKHLYRNGYDKPILVLVDALDEAYSDVNEGRRLVRLLSSLADLPEQVRILATSRPDPRVIKHFRQERLFDLVVDAPQDSADIYEFAQSWLLHRSKLELDEPSANQLARYIDNAASGIFLYAYLVLRDVVPALQLPITEEEFQLPKDLSDLYQNFLTRELGQDEDRWFDELKPLLGLIAVAQGDGLTRSQLKKLLGHDPTKNLRICHQYLSGELNDGPFRLFHKSLADYLLDDEDNTDYEIDAVEMYGCLADQIDLKMVDWYGPEIDPYYLRNLPAHMNGAGRQAELRQLLLDFGYLRAKLELSTVIDLISDFDLVTEDRQEPERLEQEVRLVRGALQLSAPILAREKKQLSSQLYGRLLSLTQPEIVSFREHIADQISHPWLKPQVPTMIPPGGPLIRILGGDIGRVYSVALSRDGRTVVSGSADATVRLWDVETGRELKRFKGHDKGVTSVALSEDGCFLVSGSEDKTIRLWEVETAHELKCFKGHTRAVSSIALDDGGRFLISASSEPFTIGGLAWGDKDVLMWDVNNPDQEPKSFSDHEDIVRSVALSVDGSIMVSGSDDKTIRLWNVETREPLQRFNKHTRRVKAVALSADGCTVASGSDDNTVRLWDVKTGQERQCFEGHTGSVNSVTLSADGRTVVSGSSDGTVRIWDVETRKELQKFEGHNHSVESVALSADGHTLVSGSFDGTVRIWDVRSSDKVPFWKNWEMTPIALSANGRSLVSGSEEGKIHVWDVETGQELRSFKGHERMVHLVALNADGSRLVSGSFDRTVRLWNMETLKELKQFKISDPISSMALSADGRILAIGTYDRTIHVEWLEEGQSRKFKENTSFNSVALNADGQILVGGGDFDIYRWYTGIKTSASLFRGHEDTVNLVALSANGRTLLSNQVHEPLIRQWDVKTRKPLRTFEGHTGRVNSVAVSADGRVFVSGSDDKTIRLWEVETGHELAIWTGDSEILACDISGDGKLIVAIPKMGSMQIFKLENFE